MIGIDKIQSLGFEKAYEGNTKIFRLAVKDRGVLEFRLGEQLLAIWSGLGEYYDYGFCFYPTTEDEITNIIKLLANSKES